MGRHASLPLACDVRTTAGTLFAMKDSLSSSRQHRVLIAVVIFIPRWMQASEIVFRVLLEVWC
jgi:hypothetical protein